MEIKQFVFNPFGVNCYILSNSKGEAILIDPSVSNAREQAALTDYLKSENLKVVRVLNTHLHLDHVLGNAFAERTFGVKAEAHKDDTFLLDAQKEQSQMFGLPCNDLAPALGNYLSDGDIVEIAEIRLQVIHVAGHSNCRNPSASDSRCRAFPGRSRLLLRESGQSKWTRQCSSAPFPGRYHFRRKPRSQRPLRR